MPETAHSNVACRIFRAAGEISWDEPLHQAAEFAGTIDRRQIINIPHSSDGGSGAVGVWYVRKHL